MNLSVFELLIRVERLLIKKLPEGGSRSYSIERIVNSTNETRTLKLKDNDLGCVVVAARFQQVSQDNEEVEAFSVKVSSEADDVSVLVLISDEESLSNESEKITKMILGGLPSNLASQEQSGGEGTEAAQVEAGESAG